MRLRRGISNTVATALLIVVAIALAVAIYFGSQGMVSTSDYVQVQGFKVQNKYVVTNGQQVQIVVAGLRLIPKTDNPLTIKQITVTVTYSDGNTETGTITYDPATGQWGTWNGLPNINPQTPQGPGTISPGNTVELLFTFRNANVATSGHIVSLSFQVVVEDPTGAEYSFSSNEISLS